MDPGQPRKRCWLDHSVDTCLIFLPSPVRWPFSSLFQAQRPLLIHAQVLQLIPIRVSWVSKQTSHNAITCLTR